MALIPTQTISVTDYEIEFAAAAAGDTANIAGHTCLEVKNTAGASMTVTMVAPGNLATGDAYPDKVYTVPATTGHVRIPLLAAYANATDGMAYITYSTTTSVTRAVVKY